MEKPEWLDPLFAAIDATDTERFISYLADDCLFRFGSGPEILGRDKIKEAVTQFFATISGLKHDIHMVWVDDENVIVKGEVVYTRKDGSNVQLPFMNLLAKAGEDKIKEYHIYADIGPLYRKE